MIRISGLKIRPDEDEGKLQYLAEKKLKTKVRSLSVVRKSVDARKEHGVHLVYTVDVAAENEKTILSLQKGNDVRPAREPAYTLLEKKPEAEKRPVVVGFGPAGMFAALVLAECGQRPIVLERGQSVEERKNKVKYLREKGVLDPESNLQFGEGGAGAFSDGKLNTGVTNERIPWVLQQLVRAGAPENILTDAKPHIGTDILPDVCANIRKRIHALGGEVLFSEKLVDLETENGKLTAAITETKRFPCERLILAVGHSARDTFEFLCRLHIPMQPKAFAMGVRIEHLRKEIEKAQYGDWAGCKSLPAADYSMAAHPENGRACYTFCMCPGGEVMAASSEEGRLCINGGSPNQRDCVNSNAALVVTVNPEDFPYKGILGGMLWQREIEKTAYLAGGGNYAAPVQTIGSFLHKGKADFTDVLPSYRPGVQICDLHTVLPDVLTDTLEKSMPIFASKLSPFAGDSAVLTAPETRTSSPVRILRDDDCQSIALRGLYPCGEGGGWAGGIVSAAVDGMRCAEMLLKAI